MFCTTFAQLLRTRVNILLELDLSIAPHHITSIVYFDESIFHLGNQIDLKRDPSWKDEMNMSKSQVKAATKSARGQPTPSLRVCALHVTTRVVDCDATALHLLR